MPQPPNFISPLHRQQLQAELESSAPSSSQSRNSSVAPSLLSSRRPSLSDLADHTSSTELEAPTEAWQRRWSQNGRTSSASWPPRAGPSKATASKPAQETASDEAPPSVGPSHRNVQNPSLVVISGGSAANSLVEAFVHLASSIIFVLPVSDNGGSSSELIRVFGGPSIGDLRSRLIRLIPGKDEATEAIKQLLSYRLSTTEPARPDWLAIVEGHHELWSGMPSDRKEILRSFLVHFEAQVLARAHRRFNFAGGSIGNFFLWACLSFFRNIESAIYMFSTLTRIPEHHVVCPCINTNSIVTIAAELQDGSHIVGQNAISHPEAAVEVTGGPSFEGTTGLFLGEDDQLGNQDSAPTGSGVNPNLIVSKEVDLPLPSFIKSLYYINNYGMRVSPRPNPRYIQALSERDMLVYSCGSLYTSLMPCLALPGVAEAIAASSSTATRPLKSKVLLLNSLPDRETPKGYTAVDYIQAITDALNDNLDPSTPRHLAHDYITHCVFVTGSEITVQVEAIRKLGIQPIEVPSSSRSRPLLGEAEVYEALKAIAHA